jgi:hypothetical protein
MPRPDDRETHQCTLRNDFTVAIGMLRGPFEMDVGDGLEVMRRSRWIHVWAGPLHIPYVPRPHIIPLTAAEPTKWFTLASWCKLLRSRLAPNRLGAWDCMEKPKNQANRFWVRASQRPAKVSASGGIHAGHDVDFTGDKPCGND